MLEHKLPPARACGRERLSDLQNVIQVEKERFRCGHFASFRSVWSWTAIILLVDSRTRSVDECRPNVLVQEKAPVLRSCHRLEVLEA